MNKPGKALMAAIKSDDAVTSADVRTGLQVAFGDAETALAQQLGINLDASTDVRTELAIVAYNAATRHMIEAGLLLASIKAEMDQDAFVAMVEQRGMHKVRAYELMRGATFAARLPEDQRAQVLALPKSKVLALASADPQVVEAMLEDGDTSVDLLSVRALRERIRELEAAHADVETQRDAAEAELSNARARLNKASGPRKDAVPIVIADARAEVAALIKQAEMCVDSVRVVAAEVMQMNGAAFDWQQPTLRLAVAGLLAVRLQIDGLASTLAEVLPEGALQQPAPALAHFTQAEVLETARTWSQLVQVHAHEAALRTWEREQQRPRGKGRPNAKPTAPDLA